MKILQVAPIWETVPPPAYGGTETVVSVLTEELVRRGHEVTLCASGDSITTAALFSVFPRSLRLAGLQDEALQYALVHTASALRLASDFDVVHVHNGPPAELGMALSHLVETPMLVTLHNMPAEDGRFIWSNYRGWYNAISRTQAKALPPLPSAHFAGAVYNGIDVDSFPYCTDKEDYFLFIGRITEDKAPHVAVEAARRAGVRLIIAGKIGLESERRYFKDVLAPLLDGRQFRFLGEADAAEKRRLFAGARALLMPLQWDEPFGLVMIEAMACGTPVIAFERGAASEIIADGRTGFLVRDESQMAEAIGRVPSLSPAACRRNVEERFSPAALAGAYLGIYERIARVKEPLDEPVFA